jgi:lipopolysaccharide biosynthesis protein
MTPLAGGEGRGPGTVRELMHGQVRVEDGDPRVVRGDRIAVVAHWDVGGRVDRSTATLVAELQRGGYVVVVCSTADAPVALRWPAGGLVDPDRIVVLRRPNIGHDFGSWSVALERFPGVPAMRHVILVNASMLGPLQPLQPLIDRFEGSTADAWGLTGSTTITPHIQSYFLGFRNGVLTDAPLARFCADIRPWPDRYELVANTELRLGQLLAEAGYAVEAAFPSDQFGPDGTDPCIHGWRRLLRHDFPFVKRSIFDGRAGLLEAAEVAAFVERRFGVDLEDWR